MDSRSVPLKIMRGIIIHPKSIVKYMRNVSVKIRQSIIKYGHEEYGIDSYELGVIWTGDEQVSNRTAVGETP